MNLIDLTGKRFGRLIVKNRSENNQRGSALWECVCDCGQTKIIPGYNLRRGLTVSCGCRMREVGRENAIHGMRNTKVYEAWKHMRARCSKPYARGYDNYGARGILVCEKWFDSFAEFYKDVGDPPTDSHSLERLDVNGNYEPENVVWASDIEQRRNKRTTLWIEYRGERKSLAEWCECLGFNYKRVRQRLKKYGLSVDDAFERELRAKA